MLIRVILTYVCQYRFWFNAGITQKGCIPSSFSHRVLLFSCLLLCYSSGTVLGQDSFFQFPETVIEELSPEAMVNDEQIIYIQDRWKFKSGDDLSWAEPDFDDSDWDFISTNLTQSDLAFIDWDGIGWFRKEFRVSPDLAGKPIALLIERHFGASEIYLNGEKIVELGSFSTHPADVVAYNDKMPIPIVFSGSEYQTMAVRFINPDFSQTGPTMGNNGFRLLLGDWHTHQQTTYSFIAGWTSSNMFYIGLLLAFAIIHFFLYIFYPKERRNLYFAIFVGMLAVLSYVYFRMELVENTFANLDFYRFLWVAEVLVLTFAARFTHSIDKNLAPFYSNFLVAAGILVAAFVWFSMPGMVLVREIAILLLVIEILRSVTVMLYKNRSGIWVLGAGVLVFVISLLCTVLINMDVISGNIQFVNIAGSGGLVLAMSIFLSRDFALTQRNLESKLREVQILSEKTLEQERIHKEREIEKRLLEAENSRKTHELEEARALQLSMLPKKMPTLPGYDIAVFMETATEVGGDYYDYANTKDGTLILALGDATGHGMKAGIMVAAAKSYFHSLIHEDNCVTMLKKMSCGLRNMNMNMMYMGLTLVRCNGNTFQIATAGMPPALVYRADDNKVERITLKGLPLGSRVNYPYKQFNFNLGKGDILLLMSDGLMELFDGNRNQLGLNRVEHLLMKYKDSGSHQLVKQYKQLIVEWSGESDPEDDVTLLVIKHPE